MSISLVKGGNTSLDKSLKKLFLGLGWNVRRADGASFDLDASAFLLDSNGRAKSDSMFIFYNQPQSECGGVIYKGDNRTGQGDGDDEIIQINLEKIKTEVDKVVIVVSIDQATERRQNFGQVEKASIRLVDETNGQEYARYDLSEDYSSHTAVIFGELYRHNGIWKFKAIGEGFEGGLAAVARSYGINIG